MSAENKAELQLVNDLRNRISGMERQLAQSRGVVQPIGNGSLNYATFTNDVTFGPVNVGANGVHNFTIGVMSSDFTYNHQPAINRMTMMDFMFTVYVDVQDKEHLYPFGSAISIMPLFVSWWADRYYTSLNEASGQHYYIIQLHNLDTVAHNYYINANMLFPRPALKRI